MKCFPDKTAIGVVVGCLDVASPPGCTKGLGRSRRGQIRSPMAAAITIVEMRIMRIMRIIRMMLVSPVARTAFTV